MRQIERAQKVGLETPWVQWKAGPITCSNHNLKYRLCEQQVILILSTYLKYRLCEQQVGLHTHLYFDSRADYIMLHRNRKLYRLGKLNNQQIPSLFEVSLVSSLLFSFNLNLTIRGASSKLHLSSPPVNLRIVMI